MNLVLGGTGTLGTAFVEQLEDKSSVIVYSRDELKQQKMKVKFPECRYIIGDIRDSAKLRRVAQHVDTIWHFAALKHIDVCEENPDEAIATNVQGTINAAESAMDMGVRRFVFSSTDKAVLPINIYGYCKGLSERYLNSLETATSFYVFRWGNVIGSRGSAIPYFIRSILAEKPVNLTHEDMTRFWIPIEDAVKFMIDAADESPSFATKIPYMKAATVVDVIETIAAILSKSVIMKTVGIRRGEKIHECIYSSHEYCINSNGPDIQMSRAELTAMLRPIVERITSE